MTVKINETWSVERDSDGGFILTESKKIGAMTEIYHHFPNLEMCANKVMEAGFDNDADTINEAVAKIKFYGQKITEQLSEVVR